MSTALEESNILPSKLTKESVVDQVSLEKEELSFPGTTSTDDNVVPTNKWEL